MLGSQAAHYTTLSPAERENSYGARSKGYLFIYFSSVIDKKSRSTLKTNFVNYFLVLTGWEHGPLTRKFCIWFVQFALGNNEKALMLLVMFIENQNITPNLIRFLEVSFI